MVPPLVPASVLGMATSWSLGAARFPSPRLNLSGTGRRKLNEQFGSSWVYTPAGLVLFAPLGGELGEQFS